MCVCPGWREVIQAAINRSSHYLTLYSDCISASVIVELSLYCPTVWFEYTLWSVTRETDSRVELP